MIVRLRKRAVVDGRHRDPGYIGDVGENYARTLREQARAQVFENREQAEFAEYVDETLPWPAIQALAADVREAHGDDLDDTGDDRWELVEYIGRHADSVHVADIPDYAGPTTDEETGDDTEQDTESDGESA
ncbi:MAG: hypothetical protein ABEN55_00560 [Bradymonadaceae bacterium]